MLNILVGGWNVFLITPKRAYQLTLRRTDFNKKHIGLFTHYPFCSKPGGFGLVWTGIIHHSNNSALTVHTVKTFLTFVSLFFCFLKQHKSSSRNRHKHLDSLQSFVARATRELIWLNEKEEEEVAYDWSDRNQNISAKKDYHAVSTISLKVSFL